MLNPQVRRRKRSPKHAWFLGTQSSIRLWVQMAEPKILTKISTKLKEGAKCLFCIYLNALWWAAVAFRNGGGCGWASRQGNCLSWFTEYCLSVGMSKSGKMKHHKACGWCAVFPPQAWWNWWLRGIALGSRNPKKIIITLFPEKLSKKLVTGKGGS